MGLRALLEDAGIDVQRDNVQIAPVPRPPGRTVNFGITAARRLEERVIDGFWLWRDKHSSAYRPPIRIGFLADPRGRFIRRSRMRTTINDVNS